MTVCLALLGDSASPGARKRMFSGFPYWKRHMLSTYGIEVAGPASLGGISSQTVPRGPSPLPWATEHYAVLRVWQPVLWVLAWTLCFLDYGFPSLLTLPSYISQHSAEWSSSFLSHNTKMPPCMFMNIQNKWFVASFRGVGAWCGATLALTAVPS